MLFHCLVRALSSPQCRGAAGSVLHQKGDHEESVLEHPAKYRKVNRRIGGRKSKRISKAGSMVK